MYIYIYIYIYLLNLLTLHHAVDGIELSNDKSITYYKKEKGN